MTVVQCHDILREELPHIHVVRRRSAEYLRVARPAHAFVALRAVRGHRQEIAALSPVGIGPQLIYQRRRAVKAARILHFGVQYAGCHRPGRQRLRNAGYFNVAEAPVCQRRIPCLPLGIPAENIHIRILGRAQVLRVQRPLPAVSGSAAVIEHFGKAEFYRLPRLTRERERCHAGQILPEIIDVGLIRNLTDRNRLHAVHDLDIACKLGNNLPYSQRARRGHADRRPACPVKAGIRPPRRQTPGVVSLPVKQIVFQHRTVCIGAPVAVADNADGRSVRKSDDQLADKGRRRSARSTSRYPAARRAHLRRCGQVTSHHRSGTECGNRTLSRRASGMHLQPAVR